MMYGHFAAVYDALMEQVPYEAWCGCIQKILSSDGIKDGLLLDLGCGTGTATLLLSRMGYDMIGVDASEEMLLEAKEKLTAGGLRDVLLLNQDMRDFELYGTVRAVISMCDTLNYCGSEEELLNVFRLVNNYLDPGGLFIFDLNTPYKYRHVLGDNVFAATEKDCAYIWENGWFEEEMTNQYDLTLFIRESGSENSYARYHEFHSQRAFLDETVCALLERAGLRLEKKLDAYTDRAPGNQTERVVYVAREQGKTAGI